MSQKPDKTAADYMAIGVCPGLIMVLVGSLVFFLLQIGYAGQDLNRLRWTLFWFVFAMVLVSRIAIEQSPGAAFLYGLALACATSVMLTQYIGFLWGVWLLLGVVWWTCNRIVWDCTLIDEEQDSSGQGLLGLSQLDRWTKNQLARVRSVAASDTGPASQIPLPSLGPASPPFAPRIPGARARPKAPAKRPRNQDVHAPGLWVLYFSFAAIPVFGLGELILKADDAQGRSISFGLLFAYVSAGLALLLLTSFLGLRRYLRQRRLVMPPAMAASWVTSGLAILAGVLLLALLLPRPATPYSLAAFVTKLGSRQHELSERTRSHPDGADTQKPGSGATNPDSPPPDNTTSKGQTQGKQTGTKGKSTPGTDQTPPTPKFEFKVEKWVSCLAAGLLIGFVLYRFRPQISASLKSLADFVKRLSLARKRKRPAKTPRIALKGAGAERGPALVNPFHTGQADRMSMAELVRHTFEALKTWAQSRGFAPDASETPLELGERLSEREPVLTNEILLLSSYYAHLAYANQVPAEEAKVVMKRLWSVMASRSP